MKTAFRSDEWSRRRFMEGTAKTFLGVGALGLTSRVPLAAGEEPGLPERIGGAKHVIYLYMNGGMTHLDTFDTKPGHENQGETKTIPTAVDGIAISSLLPSLAAQADKLAIVRSLTSTAGAHDQGNYLMHTSYDRGATIRHPGIGAWSLKFKGRLNPNLPGSVFIGGDSRINGGGGFFEPQFEPLTISDPNAGLKNSKLRGMKKEEFDHRLALGDAFGQAVEAHQRGAADGLGDVVVDGHVGTFHQGTLEWISRVRYTTRNTGLFQPCFPSWSTLPRHVRSGLPHPRRPGLLLCGYVTHGPAGPRHRRRGPGHPDCGRALRAHDRGLRGQVPPRPARRPE